MQLGVKYIFGTMRVSQRLVVYSNEKPKSVKTPKSEKGCESVSPSLKPNTSGVVSDRIPEDRKKHGDSVMENEPQKIE